MDILDTKFNFISSKSIKFYEYARNTKLIAHMDLIVSKTKYYRTGGSMQNFSYHHCSRKIYPNIVLLPMSLCFGS